MRSLKRLAKLPKTERKLLFEAVFAVLIARIMLHYFPLRKVQRLLTHISTDWPSRASCGADQIGWAAQKAGLIAGSNCLLQALAAQALLVRYEYKASLTIGVASDEKRGFEAHAWVTSEDQIVIGDHDASRYTAILTLRSLP